MRLKKRALDDVLLFAAIVWKQLEDLIVPGGSRVTQETELSVLSIRQVGSSG
jgi:hypothetical protein